MWGLMFIACNLRRIGNILRKEVLKEYPGLLVSSFFVIFDLCWLFLKLSGKNSPAGGGKDI